MVRYYGRNTLNSGKEAHQTLVARHDHARAARREVACKPHVYHLVAKAALAADSGPNLATAPFTWKTLHAISRTDFVPKELRGNPAAILACVMYGREWGLGPMESLQLIDMIDGSPSPAERRTDASISRP